MFCIYFLPRAELSLGAKSISGSHSYLTWHTFVPLQAQMCLTIRTTLWGILGIQANAHKKKKKKQKNMHTRQSMVMGMFSVGACKTSRHGLPPESTRLASHQ